MMTASVLRQLLHGLRFTPLHPQWFAYRRQTERLRSVGSLARGHVLDIGCSDRVLAGYLNDSCRYTGIDNITTGTELYSARPDISADAHALPFKEDLFDTVVMLEIAEHLTEPHLALSEARRVLKSGGILFLSTPFMYPTHDQPHDYNRWTVHGLRILAEKSNFIVENIVSCGTPMETGALLFSLGVAFQTLNSFKDRNPLFLLLIPVVFVFIPVLNLLGWLSSKLARPSDNPMPIGFTMTLRADS